VSIDPDGSLGAVAKCSAGESRWSRRSSAGCSGVLASGVSATKTPLGLVFRAAVLAKTSTERPFQRRSYFAVSCSKNLSRSSGPGRQVCSSGL
jgi:hypothetical protein